jgi:hypothetical protein
MRSAPRWAREATWLAAVALVVALFLWAPWPSDWITTLLLVAVLVCLYVVERLI